ncbi:hypothetical protein BRL64_00520 [Bacillus safensis]|nr:hypothetical protein BRL64_00520 [Bacillus safensis]
MSHHFKSLFFIFLCFFVKKSAYMALSLQKQQFRSFHILVLFHISLDKKHPKKKFYYYFIFLRNLFCLKKCKNNYWSLLFFNKSFHINFSAASNTQQSYHRYKVLPGELILVLFLSPFKLKI